ncbi:MAG TPA: ABC transporter permease [Chloroflexota bacterium]|nr:ABC transporter permease [Chloroflexota bacterium]
MQTLVLRRLLLMVPLMIGMSLIAFVVSHSVPADPVAAHLGQRAMEDPTIVAAFRQQWGLDKPLPEQYLTYLRNLVQGNLGVSIRTHMPVAEDLGRYLPASAELAIMATLVGIGLGIPFGVASAVRRNHWVDHVVRGVSLLGVSSPVFWLGLIALYVFYFRLGWLPGPGRLDTGLAEPTHVTGMYTFDSLLTGNWTTLVSSVRHLMLPGLVLASVYIGLVTRMTRSSMLEVLSADYVRTARGKGLRRRTVIYRHALGNALIPTITVLGLAFGDILAGTVLTETIFSWPGIGRYAYQSAVTLDFPSIMGVSLLIAAVFITVNLATDMAYVLLDPRLRRASR